MSKHERVDKEIDAYVFNPDNKAKVTAYMQWLSYLGGFSGQGTTALDIEPKVAMPKDLPSIVRMELIVEAMDICNMRATTFRNVVNEQLGEDFGEPTAPKSLLAEFEKASKESRDANALKQIILDEVDIISARTEKISNSGWLVFKTALTGEYKELRRKIDLLFAEFDRLSEQQTGVKKEGNKNGT
jgi:hypothetical protein